MEWIKKYLPSDFFKGAVDVHSHLLPGVDDGFATADDSLEAVRYMSEAGFRHLILTPHVMQEYAANGRGTLTSHFRAYCEVLSGKADIGLSLSAEYMLDDNFVRHRQDGLLVLGSSNNAVLVETSYLFKTPQMDDFMYELMLDGILPVIAHPERYQFADESQYRQWHDSGYHMQLNLLSLSGGYGREAELKARYLLNEGYYTYVGSDLHHLSKWKTCVPDIRLKTSVIDRLHRLYENNEELISE